MSIMLGTMIKNTTVLAEIPQLDVKNWTWHWHRLKKYLFDGLPEEQIATRFNYKLDLMN